MKVESEVKHDPKQYAARFVVKDLDKQIVFYTETIGLQLQWRSETEAGLGGCSFNILLLTKNEVCKSNEPLIIRLPSRRELAIVIGRLCTIKYPNTAIDHTSRQSTHLTDLEGNPIEITVEFPGKENFNDAGTPLDMEALFNELDPDDRLCDKMSDKTLIGNSASGHESH